MRKGVYRVALGGLISAAAVAVMFLGSMFPFATVAVPAIASLPALYFTVEYGKRAALAVYAVIGALSLLFVPEKETALLFLFFFGYYPVVKSLGETARRKWLGWALKFFVLNLSVLSLYWMVTGVFVIESVRREFATYPDVFPLLLLLLGNLTFLVYDIALTRLITLYLFRIRPKITKRMP